ncbi:unnamed protein product, partial [Ectocarpus fasciculatus]
MCCVLYLSRDFRSACSPPLSSLVHLSACLPPAVSFSSSWPTSVPTRPAAAANPAQRLHPIMERRQVCGVDDQVHYVYSRRGLRRWYSVRPVLCRVEHFVS